MAREFVLDIPDAAVADLRLRLGRTRFARPAPGPAGAAGISPAFLRDLVTYWLEDFSWRAVEAELNRADQYLTQVSGTSLHYAVVPSLAPDPPAVVVLHGWPYTFVEMLPLARRLSDVATVVVPSLPGFGFSVTAPDFTATTPAMAAAVDELMRDQLGYESYFVYGEDVGAPVSQWLAATRPDVVRGIHDTRAVFPPRTDLRTDEERGFCEWLDHQWAGGIGYAAPGYGGHDTVAASLSDSPAGLAAWITEKFRDWSDCGGDVLSRFSQRDLLTTACLYWFTDTFISAYRPHQSGTASVAIPVIDVPATVSVQRHEHRYPRSFAQRAYSDLRTFSRMPAGGHFTAAEEPALVAADLRELIRITAS